MNHITLKFRRDGPNVQLDETIFRAAATGQSLVCRRGIGKPASSFPWTSGVMGLAAILVAAKSAYLRNSASITSQSAIGFSSDDSQWIGSLDFALSKKSRWILDIFGVDRGGNPVAKRALYRRNPERKRPGPVSVFLNISFLHPQNVSVHIDETLVEELVSLELILRGMGFTADHNKVVFDDVRNETISGLVAFKTTYSQVQNSTALQQAQASIHPCSEIVPPDNLQDLKLMVQAEVYAMLSDTYIFGNRRRRQTLQRLLDCQASAESGAALSPLCIGPGSNDWSAATVDANPALQELAKRYRGSKSIRFAGSVFLTGSIAVLANLKHSKRLNIDVDYSFARTSDLIKAIDRNRWRTPPEGLFLSITSFSSHLKELSKAGYIPVMLMPKVSNRVVSPIQDSSRRNAKPATAEYLLLGDNPTTGTFYFYDLIRSGKIDRQKTKITLTDDEDIGYSMLEGDRCVRTVMGFPAYNFAVASGRCRFVDSPREGSNCVETVLLLHESVCRTGSTIEHLGIVIRDSWMSLLESPDYLRGIVQKLFESPLYLPLLTRASGGVRFLSVSPTHHNRAHEPFEDLC